MDIRKNLIKDLASNENMPFLIDLNDLLPEIFVEFRTSLFESKMNFPDDWGEYKVLRSNKDIIHVTNGLFSGEEFFQFSIYVGNYDKNLYYGIIGPVNSIQTIPEVQDLLSKARNNGFESFQNWMFRYFKHRRDSLVDCIRNKQNIDSAFAPFAQEFFVSCGPLKELLEKTNGVLIGSHI